MAGTLRSAARMSSFARRWTRFGRGDSRAVGRGMPVLSGRDQPAVALSGRAARRSATAVYYAEMGADRVMRGTARPTRVVWSRQGCGPTSVARGGEGTLVVLCHREERSPGSRLRRRRRVAIIDRDADGRPFMTPNASINDAKGGVYFSSSGVFSPTAPAQGAVLYLARTAGSPASPRASTIPTASR